MRRGRPPYPDLLTPREQEVLALIREGLTNDQIATRLGISESGARYHVSEILSKLGVSSRREAAQWDGRVETGWRFRLALPHWSPMFFAGAAIASAAVVFVGLAVGVLIMDSRKDDSTDSALITPVPATATPEPTPSPSDQLRQNLLFTAGQIYRYARTALSDPAKCECAPVDLTQLQSFRGGMCKSVGPEISTAPEYDASIHGALVDALLEVCPVLDVQAPNDVFVDNARRIVARIEPILIAEEAKSNPATTFFGPPLSPRATATPAGLYGTSDRTGIAGIDHVLDLVYAGDWNKLAGEAFFKDVSCTYVGVPAIGTLQCGVGEAEGTHYGVFALGGCEPYLTTSRDTLPKILESQLSQRFLFAAFQVDLSYEPNASYVLLFRNGAIASDRQLFVNRDGQIMASFECGDASHFPADGDTTILPRKS
ncbi:MAG TPA: helix-turn-helix transcriptional regulator [Dehalococcoidia bacterium]|nr:helix-turn-helix transcriptional regulator [Dehalococcoidia bacterium]